MSELGRIFTYKHLKNRRTLMVDERFSERSHNDLIIPVEAAQLPTIDLKLALGNATYLGSGVVLERRTSKL